ncbi:MAG: hypothetical protein RLZZ214_4134 [Verrucomicrobiota bacterium]|jgi:hypothetical protein
MNHPIFPEQEVVYHIDGSDRLCEVSPAWTRFALSNDGAAVMPERVLGRSLWDFITDANVRELYRQIVQRVRSGYPARFDYRCDAPEWRRKFRMTIRLTAGGTVEFLSQLHWKERRPRVDMLDVKMPRSDQWLRVCSWCQNVVLPDGSWGPVEEAVVQLSLLTQEAYPRLTHGICPPCHTGVIAQPVPAAGPLGRGRLTPPRPPEFLAPTSDGSILKQ